MQVNPGENFSEASKMGFIYLLEFGKNARINFPVHIFEWKVLFLKNIRYQI